ncbi:MAG: mannose-1-phosphate guanylyltransferase/mannose-6-phosphate isomerase [Caulobacteraceae bacterium]|nr:mannose-1-phosphate guanylyltransferase/mannose-6-phosphate isomerase [Caulobacteraceae bacterium]
MADFVARGSPAAPITPVVMSGGAGSRLWPVSRAAKPKQLHALTGDRTLLRRTVDRFAHAPDLFGAPIVVCGAAHEALVRAQFAGDPEPPRLILEPVGRNTAACAAVAAYWVAGSEGPDRLILLAPADHLVASPRAFAEAVRRAVPAAEAGDLVSLGVRPTHPETGYGYIRLGEPRGEVFEAARFVEKPDRETAERYLAHGGYLWNGGYFLFRADRMILEMERLAPEIFARAREAVDRGRPIDGGGLALDPAAFAAAPSDSIDYAVMEKAGRIAVAPLDAGWSDVGSWSSVWENARRDEGGNAVVGDVLTIDAHGCFIRSEGPMVAVAGARDLIVVATPDAVLVAPRQEAQKVKDIVARLLAMKRVELL